MFSHTLLVKAIFSLSIILTASAISVGKDSIDDLNTVLDFLQNIIKPYMEKSKTSQEIYFKVSQAADIENEIDKRIDELKPLLEDDNNEDEIIDIDDITVDDKDETTILEFENKNINNSLSLKDPFKTDIEKYKHMRQKVKDALTAETVSKKTQRMVTKTLDLMIAQLIGNKCTWKSRQTAAFFRGHNVNNSMAASFWKDQWLKLKRYLSNSLRFRADEEFSKVKLYSFFEKFRKYFNDIIKETDSLSDRYKIICKVIDTENVENKQVLRQQKKDTKISNDHECDKFKVCSAELKLFMSDFYDMLNDTVISIFRNYAAMYAKDASNDDILYKEQVVKVVSDFSNLIENKVANMYKKEISKFQLDKLKDKTINIKILKEFIKKIISNTNVHIKKSLKKAVAPVTVRLRTSLLKDLNWNLDTDLDRLKKDVIQKICNQFAVCNGKGVERRSEVISKSKDINGNSVYVKIQLALDEPKMLHSESLSGRITKIKKINNKNEQTINARRMRRPVDLNLTNITLNVTRTTHIVKYTALNSYNNSTSNQFPNYTDIPGIIIENFTNQRK